MKLKAIKILSVVATVVCTFVANMAVGSACIAGMYQPKVPKSLQD